MTNYCVPMIEEADGDKLNRFPKYFGSPKTPDRVDCTWYLVADRDGYCSVEAQTNPEQHAYLMSMPDVSADWIPGIADAMTALGIPKVASESKSVTETFLRIFGGN